MHKKKRERDHLLAILRDFNGDDREIDHMLADKALLAYIGDDEITEAFDNVKKWYA